MFDAETWVLHVAETLKTFDSSFDAVEATNETVGRLEGGVKRRVDELFEQGGIDEVDRRRVHVEISGGKPHVAIVEFAEQNGIDLIVMGTHGHTGIKYALIGSQAERVVRRATCHVFVVKPDADA
jgi:nucleotide-binding universal stress UspA family protein